MPSSFFLCLFLSLSLIYLDFFFRKGRERVIKGECDRKSLHRFLVDADNALTYQATPPPKKKTHKKKKTHTHKKNRGKRRIESRMTPCHAMSIRSCARAPRRCGPRQPLGSRILHGIKISHRFGLSRITSPSRNRAQEASKKTIMIYYTLGLKKCMLVAGFAKLLGN